MEKINLLKVSEETRRIVKQQIIRLLDKGMTHTEIAELLNTSQQAVDRVSSAYQKEGTGCLDEKVRGRKKGEKRILSPEQEEWTRTFITEHYPKDAGLEYALWTRVAVCDLVMQKYGVAVSQRGMGEYLKRWNMTCQVPARRAYRQDKKK